MLAGATARRGGGEGGGGEDEDLCARLGVIVDGLTRGAQQLRTIMREREEQQDDQTRMATEADDETKSDDEVGCDESAVAAPIAKGRKAAGEGGGVAASRGRSARRFTFSAGPRRGAGVEVREADWRERVPSAPAAGRAPAYPLKPERAPFQLPSAYNQRDAPRSLVEWYMTRLYDPQKVSERAQLLAERRMKREEEKERKEREESDAISSALSERSTYVSDDASSECPTEASVVTVLAAEEFLKAPQGSLRTSVASLESWLHSPSPSSTPSISSASSPHFVHPSSFDRCSYMESPSMEDVGSWPGAAPRSAPTQPPSDLQRNRAHVMGSSIEWGNARRRRAGGGDAIQLGPFEERSPRVPEEVGPSGAAAGAAMVVGVAGAARAGAEQTLGQAADAVARERRRIRLKVLGGGVRPDWFNYDTQSGAAQVQSPPPPPPPPATPPATPPLGAAFEPLTYTAHISTPQEYNQGDSPPVHLPAVGVAPPRGFPVHNLYLTTPTPDNAPHCTGASVEHGLNPPQMHLGRGEDPGLLSPEKTSPVPIAPVPTGTPLSTNTSSGMEMQEKQLCEKKLPPTKAEVDVNQPSQQGSGEKMSAPSDTETLDGVPGSVSSAVRAVHSAEDKILINDSVPSPGQRKTVFRKRATKKKLQGAVEKGDGGRDLTTPTTPSDLRPASSGSLSASGSTPLRRMTQRACAAQQVALSAFHDRSTALQGPSRTPVRDLPQAASSPLTTARGKSTRLGAKARPLRRESTFSLPSTTARATTTRKQL